MPILDDLRLSQINEVLDYDKNMNRRAYDIGLKNRQSYEEPQAYNQIKRRRHWSCHRIGWHFQITFREGIQRVG